MAYRSAVDNATTVGSPQSGANYRKGERIWFSGECTLKKSGFAGMVSSHKPKTIFVLPGRICWVKGDSTDAEIEHFIYIKASLTASVSKAEVTLEFPDTAETNKVGNKPIKDTYQFSSEKAANSFLQEIQQERTRNYVVSDNFTPKFQNDLNTAVRARINAGDEPLKELFLSTFNILSPATGLEALFTNYRGQLRAEEASPTAFVKLLSAVAQDPVIYILFLCCNLQMTHATMDYFQAMSSRAIDGYVQLFEDLLGHIYTTVSKPEWKLKRDLLLAQFQYPAINTTAGAGLTHEAVLEWTRKFTNNYRKFDMDIGTLNRLLVDEKFLCFVCLQHHADKGYVQIVREAFLTVPQDYLFSKFDINLSPSGDFANDQGDYYEEGPWQRPSLQRADSGTSDTNRHHFVDFLFHRNLNEQTVFLAILHAFQSGQGYDDKFFAMFLNEAMQKDKPRVAVDVINTILFNEQGEPSVHALKFCPKIPVIIFEALLKGMFQANSTTPTARRVSDHLRVIFEIAMRFEYFCKKTEINYIKTMTHLFEENPEKKLQFMKLVELTNFLQHMISVCNFNLAGRADKEKLSAHVAASAGSKPKKADFDDETITTVSADNNEGNHHAGLTPTHAISHTRSSFFRASRQQGSIFGGGMSDSQLGGGARGAEMHVKWLERNDRNLIAVIYGFLTLVVRCGALPALEDTATEENMTVQAFLEAQPPTFFATLLKPGTPLRAHLTEFLREQFRFVSLYDNLLGDPLMLCKPQHFRYSFLHALAYDAHYLSDLFIAVVEAAVKLEEFDDLYAKFRDLDFDLGLSHEKQHQLGIVLEYVLGRDSAELVQNGISLQDIRSFVNDASRKLGEVESSPAETKRARVRRVLTAKPVSTWRLDFDVLAGRAEAPLEPSPEPSPEPSRAPTPAPTSAVASFPSNSGNTAAEASPAPSTHVPAEAAAAAVGTGAVESEVEVPLDSIYPDTSSAAHTYSKTVDETTSDANNDTTGASRQAAAAADTGDNGMYQKEEQPVEQCNQYAKYNKYDKYEKYERIDLSTDSAEVEAVTETETEKHAEASSPFSSVTTSADADVEAEASPFSPTERQEEHAGVSTFAPEAAVAAQREEASATADSTAAMEDSAESSKQEEETALAGTDADVDAAGDNKEVTLETAATEAAASSSIDALVETDVEVAVEVEGETAEAELFVDASAPPCEEVAAAEVETKA